MLEELDFKSDNFTRKFNFNELLELTTNTIIICNAYKTMVDLSNEIINTVNGSAEYNDYRCDDSDIGQAKIILQFGLQRKIAINQQIITLALEPAMIYLADKPEDIWFADTNDDGEYAVWALTSFMGYNDCWDEGKDNIYKMVVNGRFGAYNGCWVNVTGV